MKPVSVEVITYAPTVFTCEPMNDSANVAAVRALHLAAGLSRDRLWALPADDVEWFALGSPDVLPWAGTVRGHDGVRRWFAVLNEAMAYERFDLVEVADG